MSKTQFMRATAAVALVTALALAPASVRAQAAPDAAVQVGASDLGGVVRGADGPEAGVWVIAETSDLPTRL
ncbi:MAG TPA: hypothetical protein VFU97_02495, partial [Xanthobacteraceae bacterium]|nr:hypothetical protein [Xanthobacteraceae bacterium]